MFYHWEAWEVVNEAGFCDKGEGMSILIKDMEMPTSCANCELAKHFDGYNENECPFNAFSYYDCPLLPIQEKHGKWVRHKTATHHGELYCSICEEESPTQMLWRYCPNCGAEMDGVEYEPINHGRWAYDGKHWICTNCKKIAPCDRDGEYIFSPYCHPCGARIDEVKE